MISHRYRCICVKVPKCASTSVLDWFVTHGGGRHSFRPWWYGGLLSERIQGVTQALNLYPEYATFSFVRNPYARFVSLYLYLRRFAQAQPGDAGAHPADYGTLREFAELCREVLADFGPLWGREARAFLRAHGDREYGPRRIRLGHLGFVSGHARRQADFLPDCNRERLFGVARIDDAPLSFVGTVGGHGGGLAAPGRDAGPARRRAAGPQRGGTGHGPGAAGGLRGVLRRRDSAAGRRDPCRGPRLHRLRIRRRAAAGRRCRPAGLARGGAPTRRAGPRLVPIAVVRSRRRGPDRAQQGAQAHSQAARAAARPAP